MSTVQGPHDKIPVPIWLAGPLLVAAIIGIVSVLYSVITRLATIEAKQSIETKQDGRPDQNGTESAKASGQPTAARPDELISIIKEQQKLHVKESCGEFAWQCVTEEDFNRFIKAKTIQSITQALKGDPKFLDVVLGIRHMKPGARAALLIAADKPLHTSWSELGRISCEGQSEAGQREEKMIASAIASLVRQVVEIPEDQFLKLYNDTGSTLSK